MLVDEKGYWTHGFSNSSDKHKTFRIFSTYFTECKKGISLKLCVHLPAITSNTLSAHYNTKARISSLVFYVGELKFQFAFLSFAHKSTSCISNSWDLEESNCVDGNSAYKTTLKSHHWVSWLLRNKGLIVNRVRLNNAFCTSFQIQSSRDILIGSIFLCESFLLNLSRIWNNVVSTLF